MHLIVAGGVGGAEVFGAEGGWAFFRFLNERTQLSAVESGISKNDEANFGAV
jgi:hypothetical protein